MAPGRGVSRTTTTGPRWHSWHTSNAGLTRCGKDALPGQIQHCNSIASSSAHVSLSGMSIATVAAPATSTQEGLGRAALLASGEQGGAPDEEDP